MDRDPIRAWTSRGGLTHAVLASTDERAVCGVLVRVVARSDLTDSGWRFREALGNVCRRCIAGTRAPGDEPFEVNPHEQAARATKAFKLARAARRLLREHPNVTFGALEVADATARQRLARLAGVREPSEATWIVMLGLLSEMMRQD